MENFFASDELRQSDKTIRELLRQEKELKKLLRFDELFGEDIRVDLYGNLARIASEVLTPETRSRVEQFRDECVQVGVNPEQIWRGYLLLSSSLERSGNDVTG